MLVLNVVERLDRLRQRICVLDRHGDTDVVNGMSDLPQEFRGWLQDDVDRTDATLGCLCGIGGIGSGDEQSTRALHVRGWTSTGPPLHGRMCGDAHIQHISRLATPTA